jgi:hypothetical protein
MQITLSVLIKKVPALACEATRWARARLVGPDSAGEANFAAAGDGDCDSFAESRRLYGTATRRPVRTLLAGMSHPTFANEPPVRIGSMIIKSPALRGQTAVS